MFEVYVFLVVWYFDWFDLLLLVGLLIVWNFVFFLMGEVFYNNIWWFWVFVSWCLVVMIFFVLGGIVWMSVLMVMGFIGLVVLVCELFFE